MDDRVIYFGGNYYDRIKFGRIWINDDSMLVAEYEGDIICLSEISSLQINEPGLEMILGILGRD